MAFKDFAVGVVLAGLFTIALLTFGVGFAGENNANQSIADERLIAPFNDSLQANLEGIKGITEGQREAFESQEAQGGQDQGFGLTSIVGIIFTFTSMMFTTFGIIINTVSSAIGLSPLVVDIIIGAMILTIVLLGWKVIKTGQS